MANFSLHAETLQELIDAKQPEALLHSLTSILHKSEEKNHPITAIRSGIAYLCSGSRLEILSTISKNPYILRRLDNDTLALALGYAAKENLIMVVNAFVSAADSYRIRPNFSRALRIAMVFHHTDLISLLMGAAMKCGEDLMSPRKLAYDPFKTEDIWFGDEGKAHPLSIAAVNGWTDEAKKISDKLRGRDIDAVFKDALTRLKAEASTLTRSERSAMEATLRELRERAILAAPLAAEKDIAEKKMAAAPTTSFDCKLVDDKDGKKQHAVGPCEHCKTTYLQSGLFIPWIKIPAPSRAIASLETATERDSAIPETSEAPTAPLTPLASTPSTEETDSSPPISRAPTLVLEPRSIDEQ
jgi:hypothetical protein